MHKTIYNTKIIWYLWFFPVIPVFVIVIVCFSNPWDKKHINMIIMKSLEDYCCLGTSKNSSMDWGFITIWATEISNRVLFFWLDAIYQCGSSNTSQLNWWMKSILYYITQCLLFNLEMKFYPYKSENTNYRNVNTKYRHVNRFSYCKRIYYFLSFAHLCFQFCFSPFLFLGKTQN